NKNSGGNKAREIRAAFDEKGIFVYQAFKPGLAEEALKKGSFGEEFKLSRMTWIKPSFGWMLHRSYYATKHDQERILKIKLKHEGFLAFLSKAIPAMFDPNLFKSTEEWRAALRHSEVRYQWDPDRDPRLRLLNHRALQIGIRGSMVREYISNWIIKIEDATELAHAIKAAVEQGIEKMPLIPEEYLYEVSREIQWKLGMLKQPPGR
ncbi:MAG: DUF4291 domain-containing protein, partial [bacterium]